MSQGNNHSGRLQWRRMPIEAESPEEFGYDRIRSNLAESSCSDIRLADLAVSLDDLVLLYGDHRGHAGARRLIATDGLDEGDVLLTAGAANALFIAHTVLLGPGDHLVVARPNYATNLETPYAIGCDVSFLDLTFETGWQVDVDALARLVTPRTKLVSLTTPHNPTGVELSLDALLAVVALCERTGCRLLLDQTYGDMSRAHPLPVAASLSPRCISVSSVSKTYGAPGIRVGWIATADRELMATFLAAKEQIVLTGSVVDEALCYEILRSKAVRLPAIRDRIAFGLGVVTEWIGRQDALEWVPPTGGVTCFPRLRDAGADVAAFYARLAAAGVMVGPGHWFDQPDRSFRLGWGWPTDDDLRFGLDAITDALR